MQSMKIFLEREVFMLNKNQRLTDALGEWERINSVVGGIGYGAR